MNQLNEQSFSERVDRLLADAASDAAEVRALTESTSPGGASAPGTGGQPAVLPAVSPIPSLKAIRDNLLRGGGGLPADAAAQPARGPIQLPVSSGGAEATEGGQPGSYWAAWEPPQQPGSPTLFAAASEKLASAGFDWSGGRGERPVAVTEAMPENEKVRCLDYIKKSELRCSGVGLVISTVRNLKETDSSIADNDGGGLSRRQRCQARRIP